jgi:hypothetical protein
MRITTGRRTFSCVLFFLFTTAFCGDNDVTVQNGYLSIDEPVSLSVATQSDISKSFSPEIGTNSGNPVFNKKKPDESTRIVFSREFYIAPNPVSKTDLKCNIYLNPLNEGTAELRIFDPIGNEILFYNNSVNKYGQNQDMPFFSWNMKNRNGRTVGTGTYLAIVTLRSDDGKLQTYKSKIGYKEE